MSRQYLAAIAVAAIYKVSWRRPWVLFKPAFAVLMSFLPWPRVSEDVYEMRMSDCEHCRLFFKPIGTCGSPLFPLGTISPLGCWCYMKVAARLKFKTCWARQHRPEMGIGWRKQLLPDTQTKAR